MRKMSTNLPWAVVMLVAMSACSDATNESGFHQTPVSQGDAAPGGKADTWTRDAGTADTLLPATEICGDGFDNNDNNHIDEGCSCTSGSEQPCFPGQKDLAGQGICTLGHQVCTTTGTGEFTTNEWGTCEGATLPIAEICYNKLDDDCDGTIDNGCPPRTETCGNGADDDEDGVIDNGCPCDRHIAVTKEVVGQRLDCSCINVPGSVPYCTGDRNGGSRGAVPSPLHYATTAPAGATMLGTLWTMIGCEKESGWDYDTWQVYDLYKTHCDDCSTASPEPACRP